MVPTLVARAPVSVLLSAALLANGVELPGNPVNGPTWNWEQISGDMKGCTKNAVDVISDGQQSMCLKTQLFTRVLYAGECIACKDKPYGEGYYCEDGEVYLCPNGYFCPDYLSKQECPENYWCRAGFTEALKCGPLAKCSKGAKMQDGSAPAMVIAMLAFCGLGAACTFFIRLRKVQEEMMLQLAAESYEQESDHGKLGREFTQETDPVSIEFDDLTMHIKDGGKCVLKGVTGKFPPNSLVALMGPSGGGKTTFMNSLCGRASYGNVTGTLKVNGKQGGVSNFPRLVGFVPQDDTMHANLTVRQNIYYNGLLRLPAGTPHDKILSHVSHVIDILGLSHIADQLVGNPEHRGISGGQKKRVNIGMELVMMPAVMFMDEPTSGLDGAATVQLANCMAQLKQSGLTIICVIHQPRYAVFAQFSHILLLGAGGQMVFCGESTKMEGYFTELGFRIPPMENPADWMIDIVCGLVKRYDGPGEGAPELTDFTAPTDLFNIWEEKYIRSDMFGSGDFDPGKAITFDRTTPNRVRQTWYFLKRCALQWNKNYFFSVLIVQFAAGGLFGVMLKSIFEFSYEALGASLGGAINLLFYMICTVMARNDFGVERQEFLREFNAGTSAVSYWLAKTIFALIAVFMNSLAFSVANYHLGPVPAMGFGSFYMPMFLSALYHIFLGHLLSCCVLDPTTQLVTCVMIPMFLDFFKGDKFTAKMSCGDKGNSVMCLLTAISCGRWHIQALICAELQFYPKHVQQFDGLKRTMDEGLYTIDDGSAAMVNMLVLCIVWKIWGLIILLLLKYSEGNYCVTRICFLCCRVCSKFGCQFWHRPKMGDAAEGTQAKYERRPSKLGIQVLPEAVGAPSGEGAA